MMNGRGENRRAIRAGKQIAASAVILFLFCLLCRFVFFNTYYVYVPLWNGQEAAAAREDVEVENRHADVLASGAPELRGGALRIPVKPSGRGSAELVVRIGETEYDLSLQVGRFRTVYDASSGGFTGDGAMLVGVTLFWLLVSAIMMWHFFRAKGPAFYSYGTIYYAGFSLFALVTGVMMLQLTAVHLADPARHPMLEAYHRINSASTQFLLLTTPLILAFSAALAASNIALLRHNRPRPQNALGLLVSMLLIGGCALGWFLYTRDFMGSEWTGRIDSTLKNTYATVFVYFECMLAGSVICGVKAAKHEPEPDRDFILILGCWFRPDGTLPPLLRGRVDRALAFWRRQKETTGKEAYFIPCGGRGKDEPMPEADAMRQYLLDQGVPDKLILPERSSASTLQNMGFARKIIEQMPEGGKTAFATTNYHVFRSGVWAAQAGLDAEGIGSKTKWWFWPNAFMRETAGLLQKRWKQETLLLVLLIAFFGLLSMILW